MLKTIGNVLKPLLDSDERVLKQLRGQLEYINELEPQFQKMSDGELARLTEDFRARYEDGETLDELLPEAFAAMREAAVRTVGMRHYDVQLIGGIVLHQGKVAEMSTGEGKTLVATLAAYLNAIAVQPVHVVTVNDYLVRRDASWMGAIYKALGMTVGCIQSNNVSYEYDPAKASADASEDGEQLEAGMVEITRQAAYRCDILYGTNNEFGFDYLRDNMCFGFEQMVQNGGSNTVTNHAFAIVDEVDNIFIDEARTPLIISGPAPNLTAQYQQFAMATRRLKPNIHFEIEPKRRDVNFTPEGVALIEKTLNIKNLYGVENQGLSHYAENAVRAEHLYIRDKQYIVKEGKIVLVDEFTGRLMHGRRLSDGLHEAIEAKEGVKIQRGSMTLASVTIQNYFRQYEKLAGMTGTAATDAEELYKIYKLDVVKIPTNKADKREDLADQIYISENAKWKAVVNKISELNKAGTPVLVGTTSVESSEQLAERLKRHKIKANVLNARNHASEAEIIAEAGEPHAVTVSTNMAGRGTDIILGGSHDDDTQNGTTKSQWDKKNRQVKDLGGLFVIGTERHESRRIDNQLRGRSGRQGDVGKTQFFISTEDELVKRFGGDRIKNMLNRLNWDEDEAIENRVFEHLINSAQQKVEAYHFEQRKNLVNYDDVINEQRSAIYKLRRKFLQKDGLRELLMDYALEELDGIVDEFGARLQDAEEMKRFRATLGQILPDVDAVLREVNLADMNQTAIKEFLEEKAQAIYVQREAEIGTDKYINLLQVLSLKILDFNWVQHLTAMDNMRQSIGLQAIGQRDPLTQYKHQSFQMFTNLMAGISAGIVRNMFRIRAASENKAAPKITKNVNGTTRSAKIGRNDPCHCGSGKKFKKCHGE